MRRFAIIATTWLFAGLLAAQTFDGDPIGGGGGGVSDHGALTGLGDNDHNQYSLLDSSNDPYTGGLCVQEQAGAVTANNWLALPSTSDVATPGNVCGWSDGQMVWFIGDPDGPYGYLYSYLAGVGDEVMAIDAGRFFYSASNQTAWPAHEWQVDGVGGHVKFESDDDSQYMSMELMLQNADATSHGGNLYVNDTLEVAGNIVPEADGTRSIGASATEIGTLWVQAIDDSDGVVGLNAGVQSSAGTIPALPWNTADVTTAGNVLGANLGSGDAAFAVVDFTGTDTVYLASGLIGPSSTDATVFYEDAHLSAASMTCSAAGSCDIGASATEFGTAWVQTIDDSDGTVNVDAELTVQAPAAGGSASDAVLFVDNTAPAAAGEITAIFQAAGGTIANFGRDGSNVDRAYFPAYVAFGTSGARCLTDGACDIGASATEIGTVFAQSFDDSDGSMSLLASIDFDDATYIAATPASLPTCDASALGKLIFTQDTDAAGAEGSLCLCRKDAGAATYAWESLNGASC